MVGVQSGRIVPRHAVDLTRISGLDDIVDTGDAIEIGALATMTDVSRSEVVRRYLPALAQAAGAMGCWQVRNLATVGGNLCNSSPSADTATPLVLYDAICMVSGGAAARREVRLAEFLTGPGSNSLELGDILTGVRVAKPEEGWRSVYGRRSLRRSMDIPIANLAVAVRLAEPTVSDARVVLGAVAPTPIRASETEAALLGHLLDGDLIAAVAALAAGEARPITDIRATAGYRKEMVKVLMERALAALAGIPDEEVGRL
jgi:carbon-monoxide dehydrogenase medium subunit